MLKNELFSNKGSGQQSLRYGVPEEWAWRRLSELMSSYSGGTPSRENHEFYTGSIPWIRSSELNNKYIETTAESISEDAVAHSSAKYVSPGTLLYALYGATAGLPAICQIEATINQAVLAILVNSEVDRDFLYFWLKHNRSALVAKYTQGGQPNLSSSIVGSFKVALPPKNEQQIIGKIISQWDDTIKLLEDLIAAKVLKRKGLMQKLLTGQLRLDKFNQEWVEKKISSLFKRVSRPEAVENGKEYRLVSIRRRAGGLFDRSLSVKSEISYSELHRIHKGDFLVSKRQATHGALAVVQDKYQGAFVSNEYSIFELLTQNELDIDYFSFVIQQRELWHMAYVASNGVHIEKLIFDPKHFMSKTISIPKEVKEQNAISKFLKLLDTEIHQLEQVLRSFEKQKNGIMQRLMTGNTRVSV